MNKLILICILGLISSLSYAQEYSYTLDPTTFQIIDDATADTILAVNENGNLFTDNSFKLQSNPDAGSIRLRSFNNPSIFIKDDDDNNTVQIYSELNGSGGAILLSDQINGDTNTIRLVTNYSGTNDSRVITDELQINGGADLAELFDVNEEKYPVEKGLLVAIDPNDPGKLKVTDKAYDHCIAGVLAGANGVKPGILMGQEGSTAFGDDLVTLSGRTYVMANIKGGKIKAGDFLTSSDIPGQAMKVKNIKKAKGAIIGKAMSELEAGADYVLVLVNLQ